MLIVVLNTFENSTLQEDYDQKYLDNDDTTKDNACKEVKKCSEVTSSDEDSDCSHYGVENNQDKNKDCVKKTGDGNDKICEEKYKCNRAPKDVGLTCSGLYIPDDMGGTIFRKKHFPYHPRKLLSAKLSEGCKRCFISVCAKR